MSQYLDRGRDKYCRIFQVKHHAVRHIHLWQVQTQMTKNYKKDFFHFSYHPNNELQMNFHEDLHIKALNVIVVLKCVC